MSSLKNEIAHWGYNLLRSCIYSGASGVSAFIGISVGNDIFPNQIPSLNWETWAVIFVFHFVGTFFAYLAKSPLPEWKEES